MGVIEPVRFAMARYEIVEIDSGEAYTSLPGKPRLAMVRQVLPVSCHIGATICLQLSLHSSELPEGSIMSMRLAIRLVALVVSVTLPSCVSSTDLEAQLAASGWVGQPILQGGEAIIRDVRPSACLPLFALLEPGGGEGVESRGYRNKNTASYLLIRTWSSTSDEDLGLRVRRASDACPRMVMQAGSAVISYDISRSDGNAEDVPSNALRLVGIDDARDKIADMIVFGCTADGRNVLVRVLNSNALRESDRADSAVVEGYYCR